MIQCLRALVAHPEDLGLVPGTHMAAHTPETSVPGDNKPYSDLGRHQGQYIHASKSFIHI